MSTTQIAAQMYTLRDYLKTPQDIAATCRKVRTIGFEAVQLSALGPIETTELRSILDDNGLACAVTHVELDMMKDTARCLEYHQQLGCELTAIGGFRGATEVEWQEFVKEYNQIAKPLAKQGLKIGYHNHSHEWASFEQPAPLHPQRPIDVLTSGFDKPVWFELDTYWVAHGGADPAAWIERCAQVAGGVPAIHVKDMAITSQREQKMCEVGAGNLDWQRIFQACQTAGVCWYIIERDAGDLDPFESLKISLAFMREIGLN